MITEGKGRHAPSPIRKVLSRAESTLCLSTALRIANHRNYRNSGNAWKRGLLGEFVEIPRLGSLRGDVAPYFIGLTGEISVLDIINRRLGSRLSVNDTLNAGGDGGSDINAFGLKIQIKTRNSTSGSSRRKLNLVRYASHSGEVVFPSAFAIAFCETDLQSLTVDVLGWIRSSVARELPVRPAWKGNHKNIEIPDAELQPLNSLLDAMTAKRGLQ